MAIPVGLLALAPFALEGIELGGKWLSAIMKDADGELTVEELEDLKSAYEASAARRDQAIASLRDAIEAKKAEQAVGTGEA